MYIHIYICIYIYACIYVTCHSLSANFLLYMCVHAGLNTFKMTFIYICIYVYTFRHVYARDSPFFIL